MNKIITRNVIVCGLAIIIIKDHYDNIDLIVLGLALVIRITMVMMMMISVIIVII